MTGNGVFHHQVKLGQCIALGENVVAERAGIVATVHFVFPNLKNDFGRSHAEKLRSWRGFVNSRQVHKKIVCARAGPTEAMVSFAPVSSAMALR